LFVDGSSSRRTTEVFDIRFFCSISNRLPPSLLAVRCVVTFGSFFIHERQFVTVLAMVFSPEGRTVHSVKI